MIKVGEKEENTQAKTQRKRDIKEETQRVGEKKSDRG